MSFRSVKDALWGGDVMADLAGDTDAIATACYLLVGPESCKTSIGVFRLGAGVIADALGIDLERARGALLKVTETGFASWDERYRLVWVTEAARHQWGDNGPNVEANQSKRFLAALPELLSVCPKSLIWEEFWARYGEPWAAIWEAVGDALPTHLQRVQNASRTRSERVPPIEKREETGESPPVVPPPGDLARPKPKRGKRKGDAVFVHEGDDLEALGLLPIPEALAAAGVTPGNLRARIGAQVTEKGKPKTLRAWELELRTWEKCARELGAEATLRAFQQAIHNGWQGVQKWYVENAARRKGGRPDAWEELERHNAAMAASGSAEPIDVPARLKALAVALPEGLGKVWRQRILEAPAGEVTAAEKHLQGVDADLMRCARDRLDAEARARIEADVYASLSKLHGRGMTTAKLKVAEDELREKKIREAWNLPDLSLFAVLP